MTRMVAASRATKRMMILPMLCATGGATAMGSESLGRIDFNCEPALGTTGTADIGAALERWSRRRRRWFTGEVWWWGSSNCFGPNENRRPEGGGSCILVSMLIRARIHRTGDRHQDWRTLSAARFHCATLSAIIRVDFIAAWLSWA